MTYYYSSWYTLYFRVTPGIVAPDRLHNSRWGWSVQHTVIDRSEPIPNTCLLLVGGPVQP